jgi:N-acetyl-anhydromuramyl-L-alanine amidase AmpD
MANGASYNAVIHVDGRLCELVRAQEAAWHAGEMNATHMGLAFCQAVEGEVITDAQYRSAAWYLRTYLKGQFGVELVPGKTLHQHKETAQGQRYGKSDLGLGFTWGQLQPYL